MQTIIEARYRLCLSINVILGQVQQGVLRGVSTGVLDKVLSTVRLFNEFVSLKSNSINWSKKTSGVLED
jgi:hypothetical protein